jgi:GcrA cell cycle regulator
MPPKEDSEMNEEIKPVAAPFTVQEDGIGPDVGKPFHAPQPVIGKAVRKPVSRKLTTMGLTSATCKWPIGDPTQPDFHYCGRPPQSGRPYCDTHDNMSYQSTPRKRPS